MPSRRGIRQEHRHLAVLHPPGGAGVLALHAGTGTALLDVTSVIDHQHRAPISQVLHHIAAHVVTDCPGVPPGRGQQMLHTVRGDAPACSAIVQQFLRRSPDSNPSTNARARRRGSTRANRPATRPINSSNCSRHRAGSTLSPAATAGMSCVVTNHDHQAVAVPRPAPPHGRSRSPVGVLNDLRVALKHRGTLPGSAAVDQACSDTSSFLEVNTQLVFGLAFADIDMAEVIPQTGARDKVKTASAAAATGDLTEAMGLLAEAYDDLFRVAGPQPSPVAEAFGQTIREHPGAPRLGDMTFDN